MTQLKYFIADVFANNYFVVYNGMLHHSFGGAVIFLSLQHFIAAPSLDLMPRLQALDKVYKSCLKTYKSCLKTYGEIHYGPIQ